MFWVSNRTIKKSKNCLYFYGEFAIWKHISILLMLLKKICTRKHLDLRVYKFMFVYLKLLLKSS